MKVYNYDRRTGEFIGETEADKSPLEKGVFLVPANATLIEPPAAGEGFVVCFKDQKWVFEKDYRGQSAFDKATAQMVTITEIGDIPSHLTFTPPKVQFPVWNEGVKEWINDAQKEQIAQKENILSELDVSDKNMARAVEDLFLILLSKGIVSEQDLPAGLLDNIAAREQLRNQLKTA